MATTDELRREITAMQITIAKTQSDLSTIDNNISNRIDTQTASMNLVVNEAKAAFDQVAQEVQNTQANIANLASQTKTFAESTEREKEGIKSVVSSMSAGHATQIAQLSQRIQQMETALQTGNFNQSPSPNAPQTDAKRTGFLKTDDMTRRESRGMARMERVSGGFPGSTKTRNERHPKRSRTPNHDHTRPMGSCDQHNNGTKPKQAIVDAPKDQNEQ
jgi:FtsZ-binding cell division protein ZapB